MLSQSSSPSSDMPSLSVHSISQPLVPYHSMTTRSQNGIVKPKKFYGMTVVGTEHSLPKKEPVHFSEANRHPIWQQAMDTEYQALHGVLFLLHLVLM